MIDLGKVGELRVAAELQLRGFAVALPFGEAIPYDIVAISRSQILKIQVKTTAEKERNRRGYAISSHTSNARNAYTAQDCDFIIVWVMDLNAFYILPVQKLLGKRKIRIYPDDPSCSFAAYREAWHNLVSPTFIRGIDEEIKS